MTELVQIDPFNYDLERFDMDPKSVKQQKFKDEKTGKDQVFFTGDLLYRDPTDEVYKAWFFLVEGDTFGVGKADGNAKKEDGDKPGPGIPQMVQLPSALGPNKTDEHIKKEKWQVAIKLSAQSAEKDWTKDEKAMVDFIGSGWRRILAHVLVKRADILSTIKSNAINDAREELMKELQNPEHASKYPTQELQLARLREHLEKTLYSKIANKVYRKKKIAAAGASSSALSLNSADQYDDSKHPCLYAGIPNWIGKQSKKEEFGTKYYKFVEDEPEENWPQLSHEEAVKLGWYRTRTAVRGDAVYFGAAIAPQPKAAEIVFLKAISGGMGHKGRLVKADPGVVRNPRLVTRTAIQPAGNSNNSYVAQEATAQAPVGVPAVSTPMAFDPSALASIPGIGGLPPPHINN